jgi:hypothetical protein
MIRKFFHAAWFLVLFALLSISIDAATTPTQTQTSQGSGVAYGRLYEKARKLFDQWAAEQNKLDNKNLTPAEQYNQLTLSQRTTYEAITHALWFTKLTDESGKPMGSALDLVASLENIAGEVPGKRGDVQYRLYVKMVPGAEEKLLECQQFKKDKDNTVYHKEYPLNFRQKGKYPTLQFSMTRPAERADIDVDYKSSKAPQALFNGHLTAGNSDVRSGSNYNGHVSHWKGLINWWKGLFKPTPTAIAQQAEIKDVVEGDQPELKTFDNVSDAAQEFFNDWLVRRNLKQALAFYSPDADACTNTDEDSENEVVQDGDARTIFVEVLQTANTTLGKPRDLSSTIAAADPWDPEMKVVDQPNKAFFTMANVTNKEADEFLCIAENAPNATKDPKGYGTYYETFFTFKYSKGENAGGMVLLWKKENGTWRILSYDDLEM